jgi:hypothetical protein
VTSGARDRAGQYAAGRQLQTLLLRIGLYRDIWEDIARNNNQRIERGKLNQAAVAKALANELWDIGYSETDVDLPRKLKDKVSRALSGKGLTPEMLDLFVQAFHISPHDKQRLYDLYDGHVELKEVIGALDPPSADSGLRPPRHRTALLFEHHYVGRDGLPAHHHTQQAIHSLVEGLASYQYCIDTDQADIRLKRGGTLGRIYPVKHGLCAADIVFPHPLRFGETHYLDYWTNFRYSAPPPREFRRGTHQRAEHLDMRVEFHRNKIPRKLWWAEWSNYTDVGTGIVRREEMPLDEELSAHRYLDAIEHAIVGFYWEW